MELSTMQQDTPQYRGAGQAEHDGFSLLELVVAVSIMLILGVVGFVAYQSYTDNARQAALDTSANQVLTAVIAADNASNGDVEAEVRKFNETSDGIVADIYQASSQRLVVQAMRCEGGTSNASAAGDYSHLSTTSFSDVQYEWTGEEQRSASQKIVCGEVVEINHSVNPRAAHGAGWTRSNPEHYVNTRTELHDHPQGIRTGVEVRRLASSNRNSSASVYNISGHALGEETYYVGVWVKTDRPGRVSVDNGASYVNIPANKWQFFVAQRVRHLTYPGFIVLHDTPEIAGEATTWATGAIITYDAPPTEFFDGDM